MVNILINDQQSLFSTISELNISLPSDNAGTPVILIDTNLKTQAQREYVRTNKSKTDDTEVPH